MTDIRHMRVFQFFWVLAVVLWFIVPPADAHPLGNYSINQYLLLDLRGESTELYYLLDLAEIPSFAELDFLDTDFDAIVSEGETEAYLDLRMPELVEKIRLTLDGEQVSLDVVDRRLALTEGSAAMVVINVLVRLRVGSSTRPDPTGDLEIEIVSENHRDAVGVRECKLLIGERFVDRTEETDRKHLGYQTRVFIDDAGNPVYQDFDAGFRLRLGPGTGVVTDDQTEPVFGWTATARAARDSGDRLMEQAFGDVYDQLTRRDGTAGKAPGDGSGTTPRPVLRQESTRVDALEGSDQRVGRMAKGDEGSIGLLYDRVSSVIRSESITPGMFMLGLAIAALLGAAHARSPGHGKTVMAAYLVGERGTVGHAIVLGLVVTITHTWSVLLLGLVTLSLRQYVAEETLSFWMGIASGALIVVIGVMLFLRRYRTWVIAREGRGHAGDKSGKRKAESGNAAHPPGSKESDKQGGWRNPQSAIRNPQSHAEHGLGHDHSHSTDDEGEGGGRGNFQFSIFNLKFRRSSSHEHGHSHVVPSGNGGTPSYLSILGLGVSGGIVPCPTALIVLLLAIRFGRLGYGLLLILAFSLGLASVLVLIGILVVKASSWVQRFAGTGGRLQLLSVISSSVIILLGFWVIVWTLLQYNVLIIP